MEGRFPVVHSLLYRARILSRWPWTLAPDGERLYLVHKWTHERPSSGIIYVYDSHLNELTPIDLSGIAVPALGDGIPRPPALNMVAVASDGTLVIATGAMGAQLWGFQSGRVFRLRF
jgi:hypothetical protein